VFASREHISGHPYIHDRGSDARSHVGAVVGPGDTTAARTGHAQSASTVQTPEQPPQAVRRTVTVTFDYNFSKYPPCSAKVTKKCIQRFDVWEVSADKPIFLFTIPIPPNATGIVKGITGSSPEKHIFFTGPTSLECPRKCLRRMGRRIRISASYSFKCCLMFPQQPLRRQATHQHRYKVTFSCCYNRDVDGS
jgi:hypothetical protein